MADTTTVTRSDVQGLRALAVFLVVVYHVWPDVMPGGYVGVDVFFVISGYLITGHLLRAPPTGVRDLGRFWERRARRLLPAALTVLATTLVVTWTLMPVTVWERTAKESAMAALDVLNWQLVRSSVDYSAADDAATAVQHYWSLSVEEQFYVVWPVVIALAVWCGRRLARRPVPAVVIGVVLLASFALSWRSTAADPAAAYFATTTRLWELAAGGLLAATGVAVPTRARSAAAWCGVAAIVVSAVAYSSDTLFPGVAAAVPVGATALVIAATANGARSPDIVWRLAPVRWLGDTSYSFYLWHWPVLVIASALAPSMSTTLRSVAVVAVTSVLSHLSYTYVENRARRARPRPLRTLVAAVTGVIVVVGLGAGLFLQVRALQRDEDARVDAALAAGDQCLGGRASLDPTCPSPPLTDGALLSARFRISDALSGCLVRAPYDELGPCTFGDGPTQVALIGNSHAAQWLPALRRLADTRGWTITTYLAEVCNVSTTRLEMPTDRASDGCLAHTEAVVDELTSGRFDVVIHAEMQAVRVDDVDWASTGAAAVDGYESVHRSLVDAAVPTVVIADPVPPATKVGALPACLSANGVEGCRWPATPVPPTDPDAYTWSDPLSEAAERIDDPLVQRITLDDLICPDGTCQPIIGGVVTFSDSSHVAAIFAASLDEVIGERLDDALAAMSTP